MFTSTSPFTIAASRAKRLLDSIEDKIHKGEITTRSALLTEIIARVSSFVDTLSEPSITVPFMQADEILIREFVSEPVVQADEDVQLAEEQVALLRDLTKQVFNTSQAERAGIRESLSEVTSLMDTLRLWISDSDSSFLWAGDTFNDTSKTDALSTVFVDTGAGTLVLQPESALSLSDKIVSVTIDKKYSEGGLPGNNLEIRAPGKEAFSGTNPEPRPILFRDTQPRKDDLTAVLDGNPDTWYEWERVYVPFPQSTIVAGHSHVYDPGGKPYKTPLSLLNWNCFIRWPGEQVLDQGENITVTDVKKVKVLYIFSKKKKTHRTEKNGYPLAYFSPSDRRDLTLGIVIELDQPRAVSWLQLTPFLREGTYPHVDQILVSADGDQWRNILDEPTVLNPRINRGVDFSNLGFSASSFEGVGVWPFPKAKIKYIKILLRQPTAYPTVLGAGHRFQVDRKGKKRTQANTLVVGSFSASLNKSNDQDFATNESDTQISVTELFDVLRADRQVIGIRDLLLEERSYKDSGQYISKPFQLAQPARAVALLAGERIPPEWEKTAPDGKPWIYYEVSTDGLNWQTIVPQVAQLEDSVVRFDTSATQLYFRANFSRPSDRPNETPVLYSYALKVLP
jgi:hypothetical protein